MTHDDMQTVLASMAAHAALNARQCPFSLAEVQEAAAMLDALIHPQEADAAEAPETTGKRKAKTKAR